MVIWIKTYEEVGLAVDFCVERWQWRSGVIDMAPAKKPFPYQGEVKLGLYAQSGKAFVDHGALPRERFKKLSLHCGWQRKRWPRRVWRPKRMAETVKRAVRMKAIW